MSEIFNAELLAATIRMTAPLLLVALGGLMCQRAEIFNVGLEGCMLSGAFFTILFIYLTGSSLVGLLGGILGSVVLSMVFALFVIKFHANHILTSLAINYTATGLTSFLLLPLYGVRGGFRPDNMESLLKLDIPLIKDIPFLGEVLSGHTITVYLAVILIFVTYFVLFKTPFGLQVRAVGINENAVRTAGVKPERIQFLVILWEGVLCGIAGAHLSAGYASEFTENITSGRGFTAFSAIVFGGAHPVYSSMACLLFGFADAIGIRLELSGFGISADLIKTFPYILAVIAIAVSSFVRIKRRVSTKELF